MKLETHIEDTIHSDERRLFFNEGKRCTSPRQNLFSHGKTYFPRGKTYFHITLDVMQY